MGLIKGSVFNHSSKTLWIVETDTGPARAHKLGPKMRSPSNVDADGIKTVDTIDAAGDIDWRIEIE